MALKQYSDEQIITLMKKIEVMTSSGHSMAESCRKNGISDTTYYKWRRKYGGTDIKQIRRLKELEQENVRLKRAVADLTLDCQILKEAVSEK
jgi:transposase-like protein